MLHLSISKKDLSARAENPNMEITRKKLVVLIYLLLVGRIEEATSLPVPMNQNSMFMWSPAAVFKDNSDYHCHLYPILLSESRQK